MALVQCVECGRQVSSLAANCVSCGAPVEVTLANKSQSDPVPAGEHSSHSSSVESRGDSRWSLALGVVGLIGLVVVGPWILIHSLLAPDAEDVCNVIFADRLADKSLRGGQRMLVLDDKQACIFRMNQLEEESPQFFKSLAKCVVEAGSSQAANRCG